MLFIVKIRTYKTHYIMENKIKIKEEFIMNNFDPDKRMVIGETKKEQKENKYWNPDERITSENVGLQIDPEWWIRNGNQRDNLRKERVM